MTSAPVLAFPDFGRSFLMETDASGSGLGAVLAQGQEDGSIRPIAFASRSLQEHEKKYGITELEVLGVVWAVKHFRPYVYGHQCDVYTDHEALKSLHNTPQPSGKLARWGMAIQELDLRIIHRSGRHNTNADVLSRYPLQQLGEDDSVSGIVADIEVTNELADLQRQDEELVEVIRFLETGVLPSDEKRAKLLALTESQHVTEDDILYNVEKDGTLRIVPPLKSREELFKQMHGGVFGGHLRDGKVFSELQRHYWCRGMRADITKWSHGCLTCATYSTGRAVHSPLTPCRPI